jgi:hypothetical protein
VQNKIMADQNQAGNRSKTRDALPINFLFLLTVITTLLNSCEHHAAKKSFEGIIYYAVSFMPKSPINSNYVSYQKARYGDVMKLYINSAGDFRREFPNSEGSGFNSILYNAKTNRHFLKWNHNDTIYASGAGVNNLTLVDEKESPPEILKGQVCKCYQFSTVTTRGKRPISLTYFYPADKEYINPELYKKYNDFQYNKVIEKMKAPYYKLIMDMGKYTITLTMISIEEEKLDPDIFKKPAIYRMVKNLREPANEVGG